MRGIRYAIGRVTAGSLFLVLLAGCTAVAAPPPQDPPARITASVPRDATAVSPLEPLRVQATGGHLTAVTVTGPGGAPIPGGLDPDGTAWTSNAPFGYATTYQITATATNPDHSATTPL